MDVPSVDRQGTSDDLSTFTQNNQLEGEVTELTLPQTGQLMASAPIDKGTRSKVIHPITLLGNPKPCNISVMVTSTGTIKLDSKSKLEWPPDVHWARGIRITADRSQINVVLCLKDRQGFGAGSGRKDLVLEVLQPLKQWQELVMWFADDILRKMLLKWEPKWEKSIWEKIVFALILLEGQTIFPKLQPLKLLPDEKVSAFIKNEQLTKRPSEHTFTKMIPNSPFSIPTPNQESSILISVMKIKPPNLTSKQHFPIAIPQQEFPILKLKPQSQLLLMAQSKNMMAKQQFSISMPSSSRPTKKQPPILGPMAKCKNMRAEQQIPILKLKPQSQLFMAQTENMMTEQQFLISMSKQQSSLPLAPPKPLPNKNSHKRKAKPLFHVDNPSKIYKYTQNVHHNLFTLYIRSQLLFKCSLCNMQFTNLITAEEHIESQHPIRYMTV